MFVIVATLGVIAGVVTVVSLTSGSDSRGPNRSRPKATRSKGREEGRFAEINALHEAKFEGLGKGREARRGPESPAAEQVATRAYPRNYVDDRLAVTAHQAFDRIARTGQARARLTQSPWSSLGPATPNVSGEASQFFDPDPKLLRGPRTQESGRVTALAADPACHPGACRLWVAAAGGGIWRTSDALAAHVVWQPPPNGLPTNAFGSLSYDAPRKTLYAGSGEPNGSSDSEAGLGLFRSTDFGAHWQVVPGSAPVATNRSIGAIAIDPVKPTTIYIGTAVARHGSSAINGGRKTPPNAPDVGVYRSVDGGAHFALEADLHAKTPQNPSPPSEGADWFQGGINKLLFDPNEPHMLYAGVLGYGIWRADQSSANPGWRQIFHTMNQTNFAAEATGDMTGDKSDFDLADMGTVTRAYVGDASDEWSIDGDPSTPFPEVWRHDNVGSIGGSPAGTLVNTSVDWRLLSSKQNGTRGFLAYNWCQNGQCNYDTFVDSPPGQPNTVWLGGSMNYNELPAYDHGGIGAPPRSNGRAVIRSTNAGAAPTRVGWRDMTAVLGDTSKPWDIKGGIHPDLHAIAFANGGNVAFVGQDGGVVRVDVTNPQNKSVACSHRTWEYTAGHPVPLRPADLADCQRLLSAIPKAITPLNDGLNTLQFQSLSLNPRNPGGELLGGTQDNGTWSYTGSPTWLESVGGDGGQSGFDATKPAVRYHNYFGATPDVNFHGTNPRTWLTIYDPLQLSAEQRSFYTPFEADPTVSGRAFTGLQRVWRTDDNGGDEQKLIANGCSTLNLDPGRPDPCGDWEPIGADLTSTAFGADRTDGYVVATERAPGDRSTLWAATFTGRLFIAKNAADTPGSVSFRRIDTPATPGRFVSGIAVDPADPDHAWISYSGYSAYAPGGHVYEVRFNPRTRKATFTNRSFNIGDQPVTGIAEQRTTGDLFVSTDFGVLRLAHGTTQWNTAGTGLPQVATYGITLSDSGKVLYAATHGRGAYSLKLR